MPCWGIKRQVPRSECHNADMNTFLLPSWLHDATSICLGAKRAQELKTKVSAPDFLLSCYKSKFMFTRCIKSWFWTSLLTGSIWEGHRLQVLLPPCRIHTSHTRGSLASHHKADTFSSICLMVNKLLVP